MTAKDVQEQGDQEQEASPPAEAEGAPEKCQQRMSVQP